MRGEGAPKCIENRVEGVGSLFVPCLRRAALNKLEGLVAHRLEWAAKRRRLPLKIFIYRRGKRLRVVPRNDTACCEGVLAVELPIALLAFGGAQRLRFNDLNALLGELRTITAKLAKVRVTLRRPIAQIGVRDDLFRRERSRRGIEDKKQVEEALRRGVPGYGLRFVIRWHEYPPFLASILHEAPGRRVMEIEGANGSVSAYNLR